MAVMAVTFVSTVASEATRRAIMDGFEDAVVLVVCDWCVIVDAMVAIEDCDFGEEHSLGVSSLSSLLGTHDAKAAKCSGRHPCLDSR
jgi:hypothetical protein